MAGGLGGARTLGFELRALLASGQHLALERIKANPLGAEAALCGTGQSGGAALIVGLSCGQGCHVVRLGAGATI